MTGERLGASGSMLYQRALRVFGKLPWSVRHLLIKRLTPSWTASTLAVIERKDGRLLLVKPVYRSGWSLPGGLMERGEQPQRTIQREIWEELRTTIELTDDPLVVHDSELRRIELVFPARLADGINPDTIDVCTPELDAVGWFQSDALIDIDHDQRAERSIGRDVMMLRERVRSGGSPILLC